MVGNDDIIVIARGTKLNVSRADELFQFPDLFICKRAGMHLVSAFYALVILPDSAGADGHIPLDFRFPRYSADDIEIFVGIEHILEAESKEKRMFNEIENFLHRAVRNGEVRYRCESVARFDVRLVESEAEDFIYRKGYTVGGTVSGECMLNRGSIPISIKS